MHADWLTVTVPATSRYGLDQELSAALGIDEVRHEAPATRRVGSGTLQTRNFGAVSMFSLSGAALEYLRDFAALNLVLHTMALVPRAIITRLDIAHDEVVDAPPRIAALREQLRHGYQFHRKPTPYRQAIIKPGPDGRDTGTVYVGSWGRHDCCYKAYDKRCERLEKGAPDPGPLLRHELSLRKRVGISWHDVVDPAPLFWHYVGRDLCPSRPERVPAWTRRTSLPPAIARTPAAPGDALRRRIAAIEGLDALGAFARTLGDSYVVLATRLVSDAIRVGATPSALSNPSKTPLDGVAL